MTYTCRVPVYSALKAIHWPSGEIFGNSSRPGVRGEAVRGAAGDRRAPDVAAVDEDHEVAVDVREAEQPALGRPSRVLRAGEARGKKERRRRDPHLASAVWPAFRASQASTAGSTRSRTRMRSLMSVTAVSTARRDRASTWAAA